MADILCNLKLFTNEYEQNLRKSRQQMQDFSKKSQKAGDGLSNLNKTASFARSGLLKFAGGIGLAISAGEGLEKMMRSNQTTSDLFDNNINAAKDSVDLFFKSLTTGDWTVFENGIIGTFEKLRDLSSMMDELADKKLSLSFIRADDLKDIKRFEQIAKDTTNSIEERVNATQNLQGVINHLNKRTKETIDFEMKALNENYASKSGFNINTEDLRYFAQNSNFSGGMTKPANDAYKEYVKLTNQVNKLKKELEYDINNNGLDPTRKIQSEYNQAKNILDAYKQENYFLIKQGWLTEENDTARRAMIKTLIEQLNVEEEIYTLQQRADKTGRSVSRSVGKNVTKKEKEEKAPLADGSIAYIRAEIAKLQKDYENATEAGTRLGLNKAIEEAQKKLDRMIFASQMKIMSPDKSTVIGKNAKDDINSGKIKIKPIVDKNDVKLTDQYNEGLQQTLNTMLAISNATAEGAGSWIQYGVNTVTALNNTYQALAKVIPALRVKALYAGAASAAETPIIGWMTAIAAIGAMTAAFASIPKYETGGIVGMNGIVPGGMYVGDKVLARVNSGELILNRAQQRNIASQLVAGGGSSRVDVNVTGRISGRDIEFVLDKRNRFKSRTL